MITKLGTMLLLMLILAPLAFSQEEEEMEETLELKGKVTSVGADFLTVDSDEEEWTFVVDKDTHVIAKGAGHKQQESAKYDKPNFFKDLVKVKDTVVVTYQFLENGKLRAQEVRVL